MVREFVERWAATLGREYTFTGLKLLGVTLALKDVIAEMWGRGIAPEWRVKVTESNVVQNIQPLVGPDFKMAAWRNYSDTEPSEGTGSSEDTLSDELDWSNDADSDEGGQSGEGPNHSEGAESEAPHTVNANPDVLPHSEIRNSPDSADAVSDPCLDSEEYSNGVYSNESYDDDDDELDSETGPGYNSGLDECRKSIPCKAVCNSALHYRLVGSGHQHLIIKVTPATSDLEAFKERRESKERALVESLRQRGRCTCP